MHTRYAYRPNAEEAVAPKKRVTFFIDQDVIDHFRAVSAETGQGYQTLMSSALRDAAAIKDAANPIIDALKANQDALMKSFGNYVEQQAELIDNIQKQVSAIDPSVMIGTNIAHDAIGSLGVSEADKIVDRLGVSICESAANAAIKPMQDAIAAANALSPRAIAKNALDAMSVRTQIENALGLTEVEKAAKRMGF